MLRGLQLQSAESLLGNGVYAEPLSSLTGAIQRGWFTLLYGLDYCNVLAQKLCFTAQLPIIQGGLESKSIAVDAGNAFDPYYLAHLASKKGLNPRNFLHGVIIARAFNCHQLANLVIHDLPDVIHEYEARLVAVLDLTRCFNDSELKAKAQKKLAETIANALSDTAYQAQVAVIATSIEDTSITRAILKSADVAVRFRARSSEIQATLVRHPFTLSKAIPIRREE